MLAGMTLLIGPRWFFYFHQDHHKFTQDPDLDPELGTPKPSGIGGYLAYLSGVPFWVGNMRVVLGNATGRRSDHYVPEHMQNAVRHEARLMMLFYLLVVPALAVVGWLMPYLVAPLVIGAVERRCDRIVICRDPVETRPPLPCGSFTEFQ